LGWAAGNLIFYQLKLGKRHIPATSATHLSAGQPVQTPKQLKTKFSGTDPSVGNCVVDLVSRKCFLLHRLGCCYSKCFVCRARRDRPCPRPGRSARGSPAGPPALKRFNVTELSTRHGEPRGLLVLLFICGPASGGNHGSGRCSTARKIK